MGCRLAMRLYGVYMRLYGVCMACIAWAMRSWPMARHSGVACGYALGVACVIGCVYGVYPIGCTV